MLPQIYMSGTYADKDCPLALLEYKDYNLENYIKLNNYIEYIAENKERNYEKLDWIHENRTKIPNSTGFYDHNNSGVYPINENPDILLLNPSSFLVTDINSPYIENFPLFYQHRLQYDLYSDQKNPENYIKVRLNGKNLINEQTYLLEYANYTLTASGELWKDNLTWNRIKSAGNYFRCRLLLPYDPDYLQYYDIEYDTYIKGSIQKRRELIYRKPIYREGYHYTLTSSGVLITENVNDEMNSSGILYVQKNYDSRIFFKPFDDYLQPSGTTKWFITMNPGKFVQISGLFNTSNIIYDIPKENNIVIISGEQPELYNQNIIKTTKFPLYIATSGYPDYSVVSGLAININNELLENDYIQSIDVEKGFIKLKRNITTTDIVSIDYKINTQENFIIKNLDLNPKNFDLFRILNDNVSLTIAPSGTSASGITFFRTSENLNGEFTTDTYGWDGSLISGDYRSGILDDDNILIGEITYKTLPKNLITISDCRRLGGGLKSTKKAKEDEWYYDRGKWDGEILQSNSSIVIQIPSGVQNYFIDQFYKYGTFTEENYNEQILLGTDPSGVLEDLGFNNLRTYDAIKEANKYIIDCIKRYLPVGTEYIIMDESYNFWKLMV